MIKVALNISKHKPNKACVFFFRERPAFFSDRTSHCSFFRLGNCPTVFLRCHAHFPVMGSWPHGLNVPIFSSQDFIVFHHQIILVLVIVETQRKRDFLFVARVSGCWGVAEGLLVAAAAVACLLDFVNIFKLRNSLFRKSIIQINFWLHHSDPCIEIFKTRSHFTTFKNIFNIFFF